MYERRKAFLLLSQKSTKNASFYGLLKNTVVFRLKKVYLVVTVVCVIKSNIKAHVRICLDLEFINQSHIQ